MNLDDVIWLTMYTSTLPWLFLIAVMSLARLVHTQDASIDTVESEEVTCDKLGVAQRHYGKCMG